MAGAGGVALLLDARLDSGQETYAHLLAEGEQDRGDRAQEVAQRGR